MLSYSEDLSYAPPSQFEPQITQITQIAQIKPTSAPQLTPVGGSTGFVPKKVGENLRNLCNPRNLRFRG